MTAFAGDIGVSAVQFEVRLRIVIEQPQVPGNRVVTGFAVALEDAFVMIVLEMAIDTHAAGIGKRLRCVTVVALDLAVSAQKRKSRQVVIKKHRVLPVNLSMTIRTLGTERPVVGVIVEVTGVARRLQRDFEYRFDVTVVAGDCLVRAQQAVFRVTAMVEQRLRPVIAAMTGPALFAVMAFVIVIFEMAGDAGHVHLVLERVFRVTVVTGQRRVHAH